MSDCCESKVFEILWPYFIYRTWKFSLFICICIGLDITDIPEVQGEIVQEFVIMVKINIKTHVRNSFLTANPNLFNNK